MSDGLEIISGGLSHNRCRWKWLDEWDAWRWNVKEIVREADAKEKAAWLDLRGTVIVSIIPVGF